VLVDEQHDQRSDQHGQGQDQHRAGDQHGPREDRRPPQGEPRRPQPRDGHDEVDRGEGEGDADDPEAEYEQLRALAAEQPALGHRETERPAADDGPAGSEGREGDHGPAGHEQAQGEDLEPGEGESGRTDLKWHDGGGHPDPHRGEEQEDPEDTVKGEELAVGAVPHPVDVGGTELGPHEQGDDARGDEEHKADDDEEGAHRLVVGAGGTVGPRISLGHRRRLGLAVGGGVGDSHDRGL
jgi:hypothetical protein